ncbi:MAG: GNAT family N-acetyltransferase [Chloroflexi bacterium]|nr:GNAT family N-acetyltransferase [Chloroflexota bacterium]
MGFSGKIRRFSWSDVPQITDLFNRINGLDGSERAWGEEYMRQFLSLPSCDPEQHCFLALNDSNPVGFLLVSYEEPIGRTVASGGVLEDYRNRGIGRELLTTAVSHARELGVSVLHIEASSESGSANHLLMSEGFNIVKRFWQMQWKGDEAPAVDVPDGFALRPFRLGEDEEALTELQNTAFGENWGFSPNTVEQITARVRLTPGDPEGIILVMDGERVAAYDWTLQSLGAAGSIGWISMTGVHPDYRGKGLGTLVVTAGINHLKANGVDTVELEVDSDNVPARELYLKLGFKKLRETTWYERRFD